MTTKHTGHDATPQQDLSLAYHNELRLKLHSALSDNKGARLEDIPGIGQEFLRAAMRGNPATLQVFLDQGMNINYQDPQTGQTALHLAAGAKARQAVRFLISHRECDYLIRDKRGRLPSEMAYTIGEDPALARLLENKEWKQAKAQGVKLTPRPAS